MQEHYKKRAVINVLGRCEENVKCSSIYTRTMREMAGFCACEPHERFVSTLALLPAASGAIHGVTLDIIEDRHAEFSMPPSRFLAGNSITITAASWRSSRPRTGKLDASNRAH
jgi:hypothetical protein